MRKILCCLTAALAMSAASCGKKHNLSPVTGTVTCDGSPASGAAVHFIRQGGDPMNDQMIMGIVQEDGSFELVCGSLGKGAPPGEYDVIVEWKRRSSSAGKLRPQSDADRFKGRYADRDRPLLHATVEARATEVPPIKLTEAAPESRDAAP